MDKFFFIVRRNCFFYFGGFFGVFFGVECDEVVVFVELS